jgi:hypothetical protein
MAVTARHESTPFHSYTDAQWAAIEQELPQKGSPPGRDVQFELEQIGRAFWGMRHQRWLRLSAHDQESLRRCIKLIERFESRSLKKTLEFTLQTMKAWDGLMAAWNSGAFQRKSDIHRQLLYDRILRLWVGLGGRLGASLTGPTARFLDAVLGPILGSEAPGLDGIRAIIRREQQCRKYAKELDDRQRKKRDPAVNGAD